MNTEFYYKRGETVRLGTTEGLYIVKATKSRADGNSFGHYYQLIGAVTSNPVITSEGNLWHPEKNLRKQYSESYMTFPELMDVLKNDWINEEDIK